jgi:predicted metal-binding membrane protein
MSQALEVASRRARAIVVAGLGGLVLLAWLYLLRAAERMAEMEAHAAMGMVMPHLQAWGIADLGLLFLMWAVMMVAMMLPTTIPVVMLVATVDRRRLDRSHPVARTGAFVMGYLAVWIAYGAVAASVQGGLHAAALLSPAMVSTSRLLGGAILIAAGIYQWTPLKRACLTSCRSPLTFVMTEWREGSMGAWIMGLRHGLYCVGCCWVLMALLFVAGVMNLAWVAVISAFVLVEKIVPRGDRIGQAAGLALVAAGVLVIARAGG